MIIGNAAGGKTSLSDRLSDVLNIPVFHLDQLFLDSDGNEITETERLKIQDEIFLKPSWIIEGIGSLPSIILRLKAADTVVVIQHPLSRHYWLSLVRFFKSFSSRERKKQKLSPKWKKRSFARKLAALKKMLIMPWRIHKHLMPLIFHTIAMVCNDNQDVLVLRSFPGINRFVHRMTPDEHSR